MQVRHQVGTLVDLLRMRAQASPDAVAYTFIESETARSQVTYGELDRRCRAIGAELQREGLSGERALLIFPQGLDFIYAFFGCLYGGVVPVPAYPPRKRRFDRLAAIITDADAKVVFTIAELQDDLNAAVGESQLAATRILLTDGEREAGIEASWRRPVIHGNSLAFLQYTSGSTGSPKGVMVSHGNLLFNLQAVKDTFSYPAGGASVTWLPSFHDMGLIDGVLSPLYVGQHGVIMAPTTFVQRPFLWLWAITEFGGTNSGGPNFAYELCAQKIRPEERARLDLKSWHTAYCGAEPINQGTMERFVETFRECGFAPEALSPCYGMAETTLIVSGERRGGSRYLQLSRDALKANRAEFVDEPDAYSVVSCGEPVIETMVRIADADTRRSCKPGEVGEIWVAGPGVAGGYWDKDALNAEIFNAYTSDTREGPFLRTGDLGFLWEDKLYVVSRVKDLIIIRGQNHHPHDIEMTAAEAHPALQPTCGAAFSIDDGGEEKLVIAHEVKREALASLDIEQVVKAVRQAVNDGHGVIPHEVVLLRPASLPKTSSGKIQRQATKGHYLAQTLSVAAAGRKAAQQRPEPAGAPPARPDEAAVARFGAEQIERELRAVLASSLGIGPEAIDCAEPWSSYGLDSLKGSAAIAALGDRLQTALSPTLFYDYPTLTALSRHLAGRNIAIPSAAPSAPAAEPVADVPASPGPDAGEEIAVIGMACRFPGAASPAEFWNMLTAGRDGIADIPASRWDIGQFYDPRPGTQGKMVSRRGGFLPDVSQFDADYFGIPPIEAEAMDPQQRLLLMVTADALENAGVAPQSLAGSQTGVFVGICNLDYIRLCLADLDNVNTYSGTGGSQAIAANRLSYFFDLCGPSLAVDTACSSSLVAAHLACQSLRLGESDLAIVGGVNLILTPELNVVFSQAGMLAADGRCKTFDAAADGYGRGEGCGVVVLKRLSDARRDGDRVLATLLGSAVNQDGRSNGLTAPNGPAQQAVVRRALGDAGVAPAEVGYVEAHGTGTPLGDPIEFNALRAVLSEARPENRQCWVGSVKTNIGHLESASGIAGLIKTVLSVQQGLIPPHLNLQNKNPHLECHDGPLDIPTSCQPWPDGYRRRIAGVSSFGFGGTNAHVLVGGVRT
ncbi:beta-ketoacyl synthase N-terminal-like domain-containing protein [Chromobacterium sp. CV08]|uniref:beta-ketoacyl synthase N-terminal-like domain-containing protein n=1 Tax=Chromobacterium sp. CV08 TaxID=3133274 RepID=UPI003DAA24EF